MTCEIIQNSFLVQVLAIDHTWVLSTRGLYACAQTVTREGAISSPEPTILLACGRNRELWEQPFQACAIDADYVRPDGQNSVISFVISKWLRSELSIPAASQKDRRLWGREWWRGSYG